MSDLVKLIEAALRWQPIETAPKDGTEIIGSWQCLNKTWDMNKLCFVDGAWLDHYQDCQFNPTHWMPLPEPPTA